MPKTFGGQAVTLDLGGRVTSYQGNTLTWESRSLLKSIDAGGGVAPVEFTRDASLRRLDTKRMGGHEVYVYEGADLIASFDANGSLVSTWLYAGLDDVLRIEQGGTRYFYETDLAGNVRRLRASGGADLGGYRYSAFGKLKPADAATPAPALNQDLRWKGRPYLAELSLYDMRARWWSPELGSFLSIDDYAFYERTGTLWSWPRQNPIAWRDPSGHLGDREGGVDLKNLAGMSDGERQVVAVASLLAVAAGALAVEAGAIAAIEEGIVSPLGRLVGGGAGGTAAQKASSCSDKAQDVLRISDSQFGAKVGKHAADFGLDPGSPAARDAVREMVKSISNNPDTVVSGTFKGQPGPVDFFIKGSDVVVGRNGEFVTIMKDGINNPAVRRALGLP